MAGSLRFRILCTAFAGVAVLSACGDKGDTAPALRIDGVDIDYDRDTYEAPPGPTTLEFRNRGSLAHNIVFRSTTDAPTAAGVEEFFPAGANTTFDVDLVPGEYEFYCSVPGHEAAGMVGTLVVG